MSVIHDSGDILQKNTNKSLFLSSDDADEFVQEMVYLASRSSERFERRSPARIVSFGSHLPG